ncbi:MAG: iron-containing alcohol dehydrogenase, partial [Opitutae bacterium]|nr:iron-containing alcohol dehydrogenase [Opitutae bacterium]
MFSEQFSSLAKEPFFSSEEDSELRVIFGSGAIDCIGEEAKAFGRKVLLVTDKGIVAAGHVDPALTLLRDAGLEVAVFDES